MLVRLLARAAAILPSSWKYKLKPLRRVYSQVLQSSAREVPIQTPVGSFNWAVDTLTSQCHLFGTYEPYMQETFRRYIQPGNVFYDVGGHAGYHTLYGALLVGRSGQVFCFEPNPQNFASIESKVRINPELPITCLPLALGDFCGTAKLFIHPTGDASMGSVSDHGQFDINVSTIDSLVDAKKIAPPNVMKIDVEGLEPAVIAGAAATIAAHHPVIIVDPNDDKTYPAMRAALEPVGYSVVDGKPIVATYKA